ncbi:DUF523 and DUF1722 domain-containing protein [Marinobacterium sp. CAU 1594]|nr:DUF523 and DUF1722 domain-containing protein [Marinobacterium arenosum]
MQGHSQAATKIPVGISACLLGDNVRYNGGHSRSGYCCGPLSQYFEYRRFCPEVAAGLGTPRPTIRLEGDPRSPRLAYSNQPGSDLSDAFMAAVEPYLARLGELDGYILMKNSPSCGMERIKVYQPNGYPHQQRRAGLFAEALMKRYPQLPVEEAGRLNDPALRENFVLRVFAHHRFRQQVDSQLSYRALLDFHSQYKYLLMAHSQAEYRALGRLLGESHGTSLTAVRDQYFSRLMTALRRPATRRNHCNVLMHLLGYLKRNLTGALRQDLLTVIDQYRRGEVNLATPLTLLCHYLRHYGSGYVQGQRYLEPYPAALGLRNDL